MPDKVNVVAVSGGGEGWNRVKQSGRLSGVWTCLAACTKQRNSSEICYVSEPEDPRWAFDNHVRAPISFSLQYWGICGLLETFGAELVQQAHKHGTGRCQPSAAARPGLGFLCLFPQTVVFAPFSTGHVART